MRITREEVLKIASISKIEIQPDEIEDVLVHLQAVLEYAGRVSEVAADVYEPSNKNLNVVREDVVSKNGTIEEQCDYVESGEHFEEVTEEVWEEYKNKMLEPGDYKWRIEGTKEIGQAVDWIVTALGKRLDKWAWWDSDWMACKDLSIETSVTANNWITEKNITGLTFSNITELRIINASCDNDGTELKNKV